MLPSFSRSVRSIHLARPIAWLALLGLALPLAGCDPYDPDGDGVAGADDRCPASAPGAEPVWRGCSSTDLMLVPERLAEAPHEALERLDGLVDPSGEGALPRAVESGIGQARAQLASAAQQVRNGSLCEGAETWLAAGDSLEAAGTALQSYVDELAETVPAPDPEHGDVDDVTARLLAWRLHARWLGDAVDATREGQQVTEDLCGDFTSGHRLSGEVLSYESATRLLTLTDGTQVVIAHDAVLEGGLAEGAGIELSVWKDAQGHFLGKSGQTLPSEWPYIPGLLYDLCLQLRVAPVQPKPLDPTQWIEHPTHGYEDAGVLHLEQGMRIGAAGATCPDVLPGQGRNGEDVFLKYHYEVKLAYASTGGGSLTWTLAPSLGDGSEPVKLPSDIVPSSNATLTAKKYKQTCIEDPMPEYPGDLACSTPLLVSTESHAVRVHEAATQCATTYDQTVFDLEDDEPNDWRPAKVVLAPVLSPAAGPAQFQAVAKKVVGGTPQTAVVGKNETFAIYREDPFPHHGTNASSGLAWPHVTGSRNGSPYRYACEVPTLVRDAVALCGAGDAFYRLPFPAGQWTSVTQGNGGSFTHDGWQWFALDFSGASYEPLVAARGGTVVDVVSDVWINCQALPIANCPAYGNYVAIQHDDGAISWTLHMVFNSPMVTVGQKVKRGDWIGLLGNTGNSTGPHVHFHVTPPGMPNATQDVRYQFVSLAPPYGICAVPQQGQSVGSTNG